MASFLSARLAFWLIIAGVTAQLAGLAVDGILHAGEDLSDESLVSLNPGHVLIGAGMALSAAGVGLWAALLLRDRGRLVATAPLAGFAALGIVALVLAARADGHEHDDDELLAHPHTVEAAAGTTTNGHAHAESVPISLADLETLNRQLDESRETAARYRDIRTAIADGYVQVTQDLPGIAAHFLHVGLLMDGEFDPSKPEMLLYTFRGGAWRFAGISHAIPLDDPNTPPEGFAGPLDAWHFHEDLCSLGGAIVGVGSSTEKCTERGGVFVGRTFWMNHVWVGATPVPDLFGEVNPLLLLGASWRLYEPGDPVAG